MQILLKNNELVPIANLLGITTAKGRAGRAVSRFNNIILDKVKVYQSEETALFKELCELDEEGELAIKDNVVTFKDVEKGNEATNEFREEENVIDLTEFEPFLDFLIHALENSDSTLNINQMNTLDLLLTKLEETRKEDE